MSPIVGQLWKLLESLGESSEFCTSGSLAPVLPGLEVEEVGEVGIPISQADARRLIGVASQAPYGRGEQTIVDTSVRRVWQLEPRQFTLQNPAWAEFLDGMVESVRSKFGISKQVQSELYKLLIYEEGSFFAPHRDTEKTPGMFGTLVVGLPSRHEGGTLIVSHDGETRRIDFGGPSSAFQVQYAAFYADCRHEITPVTSGYRVCLVYNLAIPRPQKQPAAPSNSHAIDAVAELLPKFFADDSRAKIVIPFGHQYSQAELDPHELKGADRAYMEVLRRAAERLGYQVFVALLTHHQSGMPDYGTIDYSRSRRRYRRFDGSLDKDISGEDNKAKFEEVFEEERSLEGWRDPEGRSQSFQKLSFVEEEYLSVTPQEDRPYRQSIHEATGNEGARLDRWYHQAAVVIWPPERYFRILACEGREQAVPALEELVSATAKPMEDARCRQAAIEILDHWKKTTKWYSSSERSAMSGRMLRLLGCIGASDLAERFIREFLPTSCDGKEGPILCGIANQFGWQPLAEPLRSFFAQQSLTDYSSNLATPLKIFEALCCAPPAMTAKRRSVCVALADEVDRLIERWDERQQQELYDREPRAGIVESVFRGLAALEEIERLDRFIANAFARPKLYNLRTALVPAVKAIHTTLDLNSPGRTSFEKLLHHCTGELRTATATPVQPPANWARESNIACKCADCLELTTFLASPTEKVHRFPRRKELRQHLHSQIESHELDLTHVTQRIGSPQTLICTKNQASYERRLAQFNSDVKLLQELEPLAGPRLDPGATPAVPHLKSKRARSKRTEQQTD